MRKIRQNITQERLLPQMMIEELEAEAIEFLRDKCGQSSNIGLGFSGGKDSVVIMELMKRTGLKFTALYNYTQIDPPEVVRFIRKFHPNVEFVPPRARFLSKIVSYCPPLPQARWCCGVLKHEVKRTRSFNPMILGIRAEESSRRRLYGRITDEVKASTLRRRQTCFYPIFYWTLADVWEYIEYRNIPYCSLYDEDYDRLGCVPCPFMRFWQHERDKKRWPGRYKAFENAVKKWFAKKVKEGRTMANTSAEEFLDDWYHQRARWYAGQKPEGKS